MVLCTDSLSWTIFHREPSSATHLSERRCHAWKILDVVLWRNNVTCAIYSKLKDKGSDVDSSLVLCAHVRSAALDDKVPCLTQICCMISSRSNSSILRRALRMTRVFIEKVKARSKFKNIKNIPWLCYSMSMPIYSEFTWKLLIFELPAKEPFHQCPSCLCLTRNGFALLSFSLTSLPLTHEPIAVAHWRGRGILVERKVAARATEVSVSITSASSRRSTTLKLFVDCRSFVCPRGKRGLPEWRNTQTIQRLWKRLSIRTGLWRNGGKSDHRGRGKSVWRMSSARYSFWWLVWSGRR